MALRKRDVLRLPTRGNEASMIPRPLLDLYNRASLFLDKQSAVHDHYWAVGIHKAVHASFPECGETHASYDKPPGRLSHAQVSPQIPRTFVKQKARSTTKHRATKEKGRRRSDPQQLAFTLVREDRPNCQEARSESDRVRFGRFQGAVSMEVGQRVMLICTIWSTMNRMAIESGTWGEISEVGNTIKVEWQLPCYSEPLWDRFPPDEYIDYFEEELE